jgi:hypothetical protein
MKKFEDGSEIEIALFAKSPTGKNVLVSSDFDSLDLDDEQTEYVVSELGPIYEIYVEEI